MNKRDNTWQSFCLAAVVALGFGITWVIPACFLSLVIYEIYDMPDCVSRDPVPLRSKNGFYATDGIGDAECYIEWHIGGVMIGTHDGAMLGQKLPGMLGHTKLPGPLKSRRLRWFRQGDHYHPLQPPARSDGPCCDVLLYWFQNIAAQSWTYKTRNTWMTEHFLWRMEHFYEGYLGSLKGIARDWYLVPDESADGAAYFEIYANDQYGIWDDVRVGYIGRNGFTAERPLPEDCFLLPPSRLGYDSAAVTPIGHRYADTCFLLSGDRVIEVGLRDGSVGVIWESSETARPQTIQLMNAGNEDLLVVRSEDEIVVLDLDGTELARFVIPPAIRRKTFWFYLLSKTSATTMDTYRSRGNPSGMGRFFSLKSQADVQEVRLVELQTGRDSAGFLLSGAWADAIALPAPAVFGQLSLFRKAGAYFDLGECPDYPTALAIVLSDGWRPLLSVSLLGVVLASACYRRQRRYGQRCTWLWVCFVLLFGLPGWVGYRFHRRWPPLRPCPSCGRLAPRDRGACCRCGKDFPRPAPKGTEIFA